MEFTIKICADNSVFDDSAAGEIERIARNAIRKVFHNYVDVPDVDYTFKLFDINGNSVGEAAVHCSTGKPLKLRPRVRALFIPQDENCNDIRDPARWFDVTKKIESMTREEALAIEDRSESADELYYCQYEFEADSPYEIEVESSIRTYFG